MLARSAPLSVGSGWVYELKWDGFRAIVSTEDGLRVRSRRGWNMTPVLPELRRLPSGLMLDGELVAWKGRVPWFPNVCRRVLNHDFSILTFVVFDLLRIDGTDLTDRAFSERREASRASSSTARGGRPRRLSTTGRRSIGLCASTGSRAWSRRSARAATAAVSAAGSSSRIRTTGGGTPRLRPCGGQGSGGEP
jgi:hypothetical protein